MRYGCRFKTIGDIVEFLKREQGSFGALLDELDGRVEMSASVPLDDPRDDRATPPSRLLSSAMPSGMLYAKHSTPTFPGRLTGPTYPLK